MIRLTDITRVVTVAVSRIYLHMTVIQVNQTDMRGKTREDAVLMLLSLQEHVDLLVQYRPHGMSVKPVRTRSAFLHLSRYQQAVSGKAKY